MASPGTPAEDAGCDPRKASGVVQLRDVLLLGQPGSLTNRLRGEGRRE